MLPSEDRVRNNNVVSIVPAVGNDNAVIRVVVEVVLKMAADFLDSGRINRHPIELDANRLDPNSRDHARVMVIQEIEDAVEVSEGVATGIPVSEPDFLAEIRTFDLDPHVIHRIGGFARDAGKISTLQFEKTLGDSRNMGGFDKDARDCQDRLGRVCSGLERAGIAGFIDEAEAHPFPFALLPQKQLGPLAWP